MAETPIKPQKIVSLQSENVKRLHAVHIQPDGHAVIISGNNEQGKTSVLDSIWIALGGKDAIPALPIREGQDSAAVRVELTDLVVTRTFKLDEDKKGYTTNLRVTAKDGGVFKSPQTLLDDLVGALSFNPMLFARMEGAKRRQTLTELVGLDFSDLDRKKQSLIEQRAAVGQIGQRVAGQLTGCTLWPGVADVEVDSFALSQELQSALNKNQEIGRTHDQIRQITADVEELERAIAAKRKVLEAATAMSSKLGEPIAVEEIQTKLREAEETNRKVRANREHAKVSAEVVARRDEWNSLDAEVKGIEAEKGKRLAAAKMPIPGMSIDDKSVTLNGIPFEQLSGAQQQRISLAMGFALNPTLRVLLLRDASLMDAKTLAMVCEMAQQHDAQVWLERVGDTGENAVIIEDGYVKGAPAPRPIALKMEDDKVKPSKPAPAAAQASFPETTQTPAKPTRSFGRPGARKL